MKRRAVAFSGYSGSGKTTLICRLIEQFRSRGITTGAIKHTHHPLVASADGDTGRFLEAGAVEAVLAGEGEALHFRAGMRPEIFSWSQPSDLPERVDVPLIFIEGFKSAGTWPRILVSAPEGRMPSPDPTVIAVAGGRVSIPGLPHFERDDIEGLAGFLDRILRS